MKSGIYKITNTENKKFYIGSAYDTDKRWKTHLYALRNNRHHSCLLQRAYNKYGEEKFTFEVIEEVKREALFEREQYYIDTLMPYKPSVGYNVSEVACGCVLTGERHWTFNLPTEQHHWYGKHHTDEEKEKISKAQRGELNHAYGKPSSLRGTVLSAETKEKISRSKKGCEAHFKGRHHTQEAKEKMRLAATGRKVSDKVINKSDEWCKNISINKKGKNTGKENPNATPVYQYTIDGRLLKQYDTMKQASIETGLMLSCISSCCCGRYKTSGGYIWKYA